MTHVIDLRERKPGCTGHPVVRLNLELNKAKDQKLVKIIANKEDLPKKALTLALKRYGFELAEVNETDNDLQILAKKIT